MKRTLLFHRDFREYTGGQGKVWDYFTHVNEHPGWLASMYLTRSSIQEHNPWLRVPEQVAASWNPEQASALFLAGLDWTAYPLDDPAKPVINLLQHVRHGDPDHPLYQFLSRRAIRVCVSQSIADAIARTGRVNGPVRVIPAALNLAELPRPAERRRGTFIGATKQPALGRALCERLRAQGREVTLVERWVPRGEYLAQLAQCRVAVLLPSPTEGFFLPGLEAMALGCATIVPDCVGNREYVRTGVNALAPAAELEALVGAVHLLDDVGGAEGLAAAGLETAGQFTWARERASFHAILDHLDELWSS